MVHLKHAAFQIKGCLVLFKDGVHGSNAFTRGTGLPLTFTGIKVKRWKKGYFRGQGTERLNGGLQDGHGP